MNNLQETVWHENPVVLGAIAGSGKFNIKEWGKVYGLYAHNCCRNTIQTDWGEHENFRDSCTLLSRSIDSLTDEEKENIWNLAYTNPEQTWEEYWDDYNCFVESVGTVEGGYNEILTEMETIKDFARITEVFIYLLSIGIWIGSKEGVEVVE